FLPSIMPLFFVRIYDFFSRNKGLYYFILVSLFLLLALGASRIQLQQDINKMIPHDPGIEALDDVLNKTKTAEQIIWTLSFKDTSLLNQDSLISLQQELEQRLYRSG